ncbi:L-fucose kinase [Nymphon striatum]|nr:L-fucose kinase [Nymphon striatum]
MFKIAELDILQKQEKIHRDTILIVVEDPVPNIGSGGATLNALLVIAEKLSVKLKHQGRQYPFDVCSKAFVMLPCENTSHQSNLSLTTNLEHVLNIVQTLQIGSGSGLWICSTDMILLMNQSERLNFVDNPDGIVVCVQANTEWALDHGTAVIDQKGYVENMLYGATKEELMKGSSNGNDVPLICGIIYLSPLVAETILSFHELSPLDCCTYMGIDSGANYLRVSLSFDILLAMSTGLSKEDFLSGTCGKAYNKKLNNKFDPETELLIEYGRTKVWDSLNRWRSEPKLSLKDIMNRLDPLVALNYRREIYGDITCDILQSVLINNQEQNVVPYLNIACSYGWSNKILACLDNGWFFSRVLCVSMAQQVISHPNSPGNLKRILFTIADLLGSMGGNDVGIRSGPASNKAWDTAFNFLREGNDLEALKLMTSNREKWLEKPETILRAARHYEKAALIIIQRDVDTTKQSIDIKDSKKPPVDIWVKSECPARVDIHGTWTDTPPQCYELRGSVININFNLFSKKPIGAKGKRIPEYIELVLHAEGGLHKNFCLKSMEDVMDFNRPNAPGALLKAAIIATGILDLQSSTNLENQLRNKLESGFELHSWSNVPQGSGLGTSSILAAAISATLWTLSGKSFTRRDLIHVVLVIEQLLTTGGGWQDQVGGITGGICRGYSDKGLPLEVKVEEIKLSEENIDLLNDHLLLIYTGKVRLARNILQVRMTYALKVINLFQILSFYLFIFVLEYNQELVRQRSFSDLQNLGTIMNRTWELKKIIAPGCEPAQVKKIMALLKDHVYGQSLAGAGGGGFLCAVSKKPNSAEFINNLLEKEGYLNAKVYETSINMGGITVNIGDETINIPHK